MYRQKASDIDTIQQRINQAVADTCPTTPDMTDEELERICKNCVKRCLKHERSEAALDQVLERFNSHNKEIGQTIQQNVETIIMPLIGEIEQSLPAGRRPLVDQLRSQLETLTDPFVDRISSAFKNLSPAELKICTFIKNDMSTKEIAKLLHLSPSTINRHREHVRRKLGLVNDNINLKRYLQTHFNES